MTLNSTLVGLCAVFASGCGKTEQITSYKTLKPHLVYEANHISVGTDDRMLVAMVPNGNKTWFFKLVGPNQAVENQREAFESFVNSLRFSTPNASPEWTMPEGWKRQEGVGMRFATLQIPSDDQRLEVSVTELPTMPGEYEDYVLENVIRWRGEMGLPDISRDRLYSNEKPSEQTRKIELKDRAATMANLVGKYEKGSMSQAPFASRMDRSGFESKRFGMQGLATASDDLSYDAPDGWVPGQGTGFSALAFEVQKDGHKVEITVTPAAGDLLLNVQRWCAQIQMPEVSQQQLNQILKETKVGPLTGKYVQLVGPKEAQRQETILGVVVEAADNMWFLKLRGDSELAESEKQRFEAFVESIEFK